MPDDGQLFDTSAIDGIAGPQEKQTRETIKAITASHPEPDPIRDAICVSLVSLARSIDRQNEKGREISRNMNVYLAALDRLQGLYPEDTGRPDDDIIAAWAGTGVE